MYIGGIIIMVNMWVIIYYVRYNVKVFSYFWILRSKGGKVFDVLGIDLRYVFFGLRYRKCLRWVLRIVILVLVRMFVVWSF